MNYYCYMYSKTGHYEFELRQGSLLAAECARQYYESKGYVVQIIVKGGW